MAQDESKFTLIEWMLCQIAQLWSRLYDEFPEDVDDVQSDINQPESCKKPKIVSQSGEKAASGTPLRPKRQRPY